MPHGGHWAHLHTIVVVEKEYHYYLPCDQSEGKQNFMRLCQPLEVWPSEDDIHIAVGRVSKCKSCREVLQKFLSEHVDPFELQP